MNMILLLSLITHSGPPPPYSNYDKYQYAPRRVQKTVGAQGVLLCGDEPLVGTNVALVAVATGYRFFELFVFFFMFAIDYLNQAPFFVQSTRRRKCSRRQPRTRKAISR